MALAEARVAKRRGEVPVGAVLELAGRALARSGSRCVRDLDPTAHAEIVVLRRACRRLKNYRLPGATLYVTLEPCPMCAAALAWARVSRIVYAAPNPRYGACGSVFNLASSPRLNHRIRVQKGPLAGPSSKLLKGFFKERRTHETRHKI